MLRTPAILAPLAALAALLTTVGPVAAQEPEPSPAVSVVAPPPDDLSGHVVLAPRAAYAVPMGAADSLMDQRTFVRAGPTAGFDLAVGISRYVAVQGRFDYGWFSAGNQCPAGQNCSATMTAFGLGLDYHLVNGGAFDPWMRAGAGYRIMTYTLPGSEGTYRGMDWMHLAVGGDWYGLRKLGFGPYLAFDLGQYDSRPTRVGAAASSAIHTFLSVGLRVVLDVKR
jgi:hypothetical protein